MITFRSAVRVLTFDAKDYTTALRLFRESHETFRSASLDALVNMADCENALGKTAAAYLHYGQFLRNVKVRDNRVTEVTDTMAAMMKAGPWIRIAGRDTFAPNVVVRVDGVVLGPIAATPEEIPAEPGEHIVVMTAPHDPERKITVTVEAGKHHDVDVRSKLPAGGGAEKQPTRIPHWVRPVGIILGGTGGLSSLMVGAGFAGGAVSLNDALEKDCAKDDGNGATCDAAKVPDLAARRAEGKRLTTTATALFVVGGALTTATVVLILAGRSRPNDVAFAPLVVPGGGGALVGGRF